MATKKGNKRRFDNNIGAVRKFRGMTQKDAAKALGVGASTYAHWEQGINDPGTDNISRMRELFRVTADQLLVPGHPLPGEGPLPPNAIPGYRSGERHPRPVLGRIAAGEAREACPIPGEYVDVDEEVWERCDNGAWLQVSGNSMNRLFPDGAMVYLDLCDNGAVVRDGDVAALFVNGDEATLKRVFFEPGGIVRLHPESYDPEYRDRTIDSSDPDAPDVRLVGRVVSYKAPVGWRA